MNKVATINTQDQLPGLSSNVPSESTPENASRTLTTILTTTIHQCNELIYATVAIILGRCLVTQPEEQQSIIPLENEIEN